MMRSCGGRGIMYLVLLFLIAYVLALFDMSILLILIIIILTSFYYIYNVFIYIYIIIDALIINSINIGINYVPLSIEYPILDPILPPLYFCPLVAF